MKNRKELAWSHTVEYFNCESKEELIRDYGKTVGDVIYFGEKRTPSATWIDADEVIESIGNAAYDNCGEWAQDYPDVSDEAKAELETFLKEWQEKHCQPNFYLVDNIQSYIVAEDDVISSMPH